MDADAWRSHIPIPHILNTLVLVLKGEGAGPGEGVTQEQLEELLPHLCLALPSYSLACADLLRSLPKDSSVWSKLEVALTNEKLHPEITSVLYLVYQPAMERELMRVLGLYVGTECESSWWDEATLTISHFRPHDMLLCANPKARKEHSCSSGQNERKVNVWEASPLANASGYSEELFHQCLSFLGSVLVKTRFSFPAIIASRDYLAQVSIIMEEELYQSFPVDLSHLAYLLTLPLSMRQEQDVLREPMLLQPVESSLREVLAEGGDMAREKVCVMLSLFPFWLPVLRESGFLKSYLANGACDVFFSIGQVCR